ncbi:MAG TPA: invasion associated locus B family protein [Ancylobacter sp.]
MNTIKCGIGALGAGVAGLMLTVTLAMAQSAAPATPPAQPEMTTATYQDWLMRCVSPAGKPKVCEIAQTIQVEGQAGPVAVIAVGKISADEPLHLTIQLAAGVWLPAGVKLQYNEKSPPVALEFKRCLQGCFAETDIDKALEQGLRNATGPGSITFESGARKPVTLQISFKGFSAALDASLKAR